MNKKQSGILFAFSSYLIWGFTPIYWQIFSGFSSLEILAHRIFWAFFVTILFFAVTGKSGEFIQVIRDRRRLRPIVLRAVLLAVNWYTYVWAVGHGRILEASLGYYLNPLVSIFLGLIFLQEKLNKLQWAAVGFAVAGVALKTLLVGQFPVVSVILAVSFGFYGLMKKKSSEGSLTGVAAEALILLPFAAGYLVFNEISGSASFIGASPWMKVMLASTGVVTVVPLFLFSKGTGRIPLVWIGFLQFFAPTMMMFLGIFMYHETMSVYDLAGFAGVWSGILIFLLSTSKAVKKTQ